jgi:phosphate starvation-inducible PhoH-like protein
LLEAVDILKGVEGLNFVYFDDSDVVRHHLVQRIIRAYDEHKNRLAEEQLSLLESRSGPSGKTNGTAAVPEKNGIAESKE